MEFDTDPRIMLIDSPEDVPASLPEGVDWVALRSEPETPLLWDDRHRKPDAPRPHMSGT